MTTCKYLMKHVISLPPPSPPWTTLLERRVHSFVSHLIPFVSISFADQSWNRDVLSVGEAWLPVHDALHARLWPSWGHLQSTPRRCPGEYRKPWRHESGARGRPGEHRRQWRHGHRDTCYVAERTDRPFRHIKCGVTILKYTGKNGRFEKNFHVFILDNILKCILFLTLTFNPG